MTDNDLLEFKAVLLKVAKLYGYVLEKEQAELYYEILKDFTLEEVKTGLIRIARHSKFFPKPSEIVEHIDQSGNKLDYDFEYCKSMIKDLGFHNSVVLKSCKLMVVIKDLGGLQQWSELVYKDEKDAYFRFARAHKRRTFDEQNESLPEVKRLIGYMEILSNQNGSGGSYKINYWDNKPVKTLTGGKSDLISLPPGEKAPPSNDVMALVNKLTGSNG